MAEDQDEELIYRNNRELHYSFDPEKGFSRKIDYQYPGNQVIIQQGWEEVQRRLNEESKLMHEGKLSPLAWYMEKNQMDLSMLSSYTGLMKWKIKRHLRPDVFKKLKPAILARYASAFSVEPDEFFTLK